MVKFELTRSDAGWRENVAASASSTGGAFPSAAEIVRTKDRRPLRGILKRPQDASIAKVCDGSVLSYRGT